MFKTMPATEAEVRLKVDQFVMLLQGEVDAKHRANGLDGKFPADKVSAKERQKFIAVNIGSSGAFLIEKATGEIFNIKGYGVPDRNKKLKANLGNVLTADLSRMLQYRYNYLR